MQPKRYIKLILPLRLEWEPCYCLEGEAFIGQRVIVRFAGRRTVGVVSETDVTPDIDPSRIQPVLDSASGLEPVSEQEINLWRFIANYYLCTLGEVYKAAYPPMKTASEETGARTAQRKETLEALTLAKWQQRVERLQARLDAIDEDLSHKHGEAVRQRLETRRDSVRKELKAAQEKLSSFDKGLGLGGQDWSLLLKNLPDALPNSVMTAAIAWMYMASSSTRNGTAWSTTRNSITTWTA